MSQDKSNSRTAADEEQGFITHLIEFRDRVLRMVLAIVIIFLPLFYFSNDLYTYLAEPLMRHLPKGSSMIATEVASPFLIPFKLTLVLSVFVAMPYVLYQFWGFVAPGLYQHERKMVVPLLVSSTVLFYAGIAFAYYVVFPLVFKFFTSVAPAGVSVMTDISKYLDFVLRLFFAFGFAFEVPIATIVLCWTGMTTPAKLAEKRPYVIVVAFVVGMLLTPPDVISQTLLAIPMWMLFELGIVFSRFYAPKRDEDEVEEEEESIMPSGGGAASATAAAAATVAASGAASASTGSESREGESEEPDSNESGHQEYEPADDEFRELTDEEMDAELERIDREMDELMDEDEEEPEKKKKDGQDKSPPKKED